MLFEQLESRRLMSLVTPVADLLVDANRDGVINSLDDANENIWTNGKSGRGAVILPNIDKDNTTAGGAPDNWTGGVWNGKPIAPNNVIDNASDLGDIGRLRLKKLGVDDSYNYRVTIQLLKPASDPASLKNTAATDRVRLFMPSKQLANGDTVPQAGDVAVIGPGQGDTIRFVVSPAAVNEYNVADLAGSGWMEFGVEGLKAGAHVRVRVTVEFIPVFESVPAGGDVPLDPPTITTDEVAIRVAPFVLQDNRQSATKIFVENMNQWPGFDNSSMRAALKNAFGSKVVETRTGDLWLQDGFEIGYARTPTGSMPVILELPRARTSFFSNGQASMRTFIRGTLLAAGVGVNTELAALSAASASSFGGDIETLPRPGAAPGEPGLLLASGMPTFMKDFFATQAVNPMLDLKLDDWLGVAHVDEVVQLSTSGKLTIADPDLAWALLVWATKLDPNVRMQPKMNGNEFLPDYTAAGIKASFFLANPIFRQQNLQYAQSSTRLRGVYDAVKKALKLTDEVSTPLKWSSATGTVALLRAGAFTRMIGNVKRTFQVRFLDGDRYQLQYRDEGGAYSKWFDGRKSRDEVFTEAKAFLLKDYWTGTAKAGDRFTFTTNPAATLIKMPVLFATGGLFFEAPGTPPAQPWRLGAFTTNHINAIVDGQTVVTGGSYGPHVNFDGTGRKDLFDAYATAAFRAAGYTKVLFADTRLYHDSSGGIHCGTNVIRSIPSAKWWEA